MNITTPNNKVRLVLKKHQLFALRGAKPHVAINCQDGVLWVTNSNDNRDHILIARDRFSPRRKGTVLIQAMRDSYVDIEER
jgi:spermidine synthase